MVILVMGVSGAGKSTVGRALASEIGALFHDADQDHPPGNVAKMQRGEPLTDEDREEWVRKIRVRIDKWLHGDDTVVLACSALTKGIRAALGTDREGIHVVHLRGSKEQIRARMDARDHFMPSVLLDSQFSILEPPPDALELNIARPPEDLVATIAATLRSGGRGVGT